MKLSLFIDDMIVHRIFYRLHQKKGRFLLDLINEFSKVARYRVNIQKSLAFLYTNNEISERETKKTIPFTISTAKKVIRNKFDQGDKRSVLRKLQDIEERNWERYK